jgi:tetratricopeptide (TPR) repeat protein
VSICGFIFSFVGLNFKHWGFMKNFAILFFLFIFALTITGQNPKIASKKTPKPVKTAAKLGSEAEELEKARSVANADERVAALQSFIKNFPETAEIPRVQSLIVTARAEAGVIKLQAKDIKGSVELYRLAIEEAPSPVSDELFSKVLLGFPVSLYTLNERAAAFDIAKMIEEKVGANAAQLLDLSRFYLNVEYGTEAIRLAQKAVELAPDSAAGFQVLAAANRLNFQLDEAANAYAKAAELDPETVNNRLSLAEMKRALGKADEAASIYREILAKDGENKMAQAGLALALFDTGKRAEAEAEMKKALEADPENSRLMASAAYWYASRGLNDKAIEYAQKAIKLEPRNVWSYIAQARALTAQKRPLDAEKTLLAARQYSDFPTLDYELASVRLTAGLYREAAETLKRSFVVNQDGAIETYLGNRILADAGTFGELLSLERRVGLFETQAADSEENAAKLKALLAFNQRLEAKDVAEEDLAQAAEEFARGSDNMRLHRQLFAASRLLQKKTALPKVLDLMQAAISGVDGALNVPNPSASVLADEIYDSRQYAISQNLVIVVPEIPRQTLSAILRGRIEDIAGRTLLEQNNVSQSIVRFKRALSVLPDKSAYSRATNWNLGEALQADGKEKEALDAFVKAYDADNPNTEKRARIENLYVKVNGSLDGLEALVGAKPETTVARTDNKSAPNNTDNVRTTETAPSRIETTPARVPVGAQTPAATEVKTEAVTETKTEPRRALPENLPSVTPEKTTVTTPAPEPEKAVTEEKPAKTETQPAQEKTTKTEEVKSDAPETAEPKPAETNREEVKPAETKIAEVKPEPAPNPSPSPTTQTQPTSTDEAKSDEVKPEETKAEETKTEETKAEETKTEEVKPEETRTNEAKPEETKPVEKKPESKTPPNLSVIVTDPLSSTPPSTKVKESKTENKPNEISSQNSQKPLFDSVVINIGKTEKTSANKTAVKPNEEKPNEEKPVEGKQTEEKPAGNEQTKEKPFEAVKDPAVVATTTPKQESKTEEKPVPEAPPTETEPTPQSAIPATQKTEPKSTTNRTSQTAQKFEVVVTDNLKPKARQSEKPADNEKQPDETPLSDEFRPRIIITENTGAKTVIEEISTCKLVVAPDSLALLNGGGSLGVTVSFEGAGDFRQIRAVSSSAKDLQVKFDAEIGAAQNRAFFIIKSVSRKTGIFTITFAAPCGRKEILVRVR